MSNQRKRLGLVFGSFQMVVIALAGFIPVNLVRLSVIRMLGAHVGGGCAIHHGLQMRKCQSVSIGDDCFVAENVVLDGRGGLTIGSHVSINSGVQIWTAQHDLRSVDFAYTSAGVRIGDRAWINSRAIVLPGVVVGTGAVVAAGAVVTKDVEPWTVVGGVPAKQIARRPVVDSYRLDARRNKVWWW